MNKSVVSFFDYFVTTLTQDVLASEFISWGKKQDYINERFGQYICNRYLVKGRSCIEIFNEEDSNVAYWKISEAIG